MFKEVKENMNMMQREVWEIKIHIKFLEARYIIYE